MEVSLNTVIEQVGKDKNVPKEVLIAALEEAILTAAKKTFGMNRRLEAHFNEEKAVIEVTQTIRIASQVEDPINEMSLEDARNRGIEAENGDELVFQVYYREEDNEQAKEQDELYGDILKLKTYRRSFGRIAAQAAKQVILHRVRDVERDTTYEEYKDRKGELINGIVRRHERGDIIVDLGRVEAILPQKEQSPKEVYRANDRVQAYVIDVQRHTRGPQIILSRTSPGLLIKLFELEVPEITEGVVKIESAAREPGSRAKIAVWSKDRDVDPVGACVGMKGSRVQAIVQELRGEKIDIVPFEEDAARFVCHALAPAEVSRVLVDESNRCMEIVVPDDQLSLAIGKRGQNVRLASQLTGWKLDIHSESKIKELKDSAWKSLSQVEGCNEFIIQTLYNYGIRSAQALCETEEQFLLEIPGITKELIDKMAASSKVVAQKEAEIETQLKQESALAEKKIKIYKMIERMLSLSELQRVMTMRSMTEGIYEQFKQAGLTTVEQIATIEDLVAMGEKTDLGERKMKQFKHAAIVRLREEKEIKEEASSLGITVSEDKQIILSEEDQHLFKKPNKPGKDFTDNLTETPAEITTQTEKTE